MPEPAGKCPICRTVVHLKDGFVICPKKDYKAKYEEWDSLWIRFDPSRDSVSVLLAGLVALNLIEEVVDENS